MNAVAAIAGVGTTGYRTDGTAGSVGPDLAYDAIGLALADAGLGPADVDGVVKYSVDSSTSVEMIAANLGLSDLGYWAEVPHGGGGSCATVQHAVGAIAGGFADVVVCFRAFTPSDFGDGAKHNSATLWARRSGVRDFMRGAGWTSMFDTFALAAQRHMYDFGTTPEHLGAVVKACRRHAGTNPLALRPDPVTVEEYLATPLVVGPLREADCAILPTFGACAVVLTSAERARDLRAKPAFVLAAAASSGEKTLQYWEMHPFRRGEITHFASRQVATRLFGSAGLTVEDVDAAQIYDCTSYTLLAQLEDYGFCAKGEGGPFAENGALELGGRLPVNTHGGHLGEAYVHGFTHILEAVAQIRGDSVNQVPDPEVVLVTGGAPGPSSALLLGPAT